MAARFARPMEEYGDLAVEAVDFAVKGGASYADARHQVGTSLHVERKERATDQVSESLEEGLGVRVLVDGAWGFFAFNEAAVEPRRGITRRGGASGSTRAAAAKTWRGGVSDALAAARALARHGHEKVELAEVKARTARVEWKPKKDPAKVSLEDKAELLREMDDRARRQKEIRSVTGAYSDSVQWQRFASSEGAEVTTQVTRTFASLTMTAQRGGKRSSRKARSGGTGGFELAAPALARVQEAAASAVRLLDAKRAPGGRMTLVADPELVGVFAHEAVGHACEADSVLAGDSILRGFLGKDLGSPLVTILDDPTLPGKYGSFPFDDEGVEAKPRLLVEKGVLRGYLSDRTTAKKLGIPANGAARAEDYASRPLVRMSNTYLANGDHGFDELLEGVDRGIYAKGSRGGQVDTAKGTFAFSAQEAFLIERGRITAPLRDVGLTGFILETLRNVEKVGDDLALRDPGMCGKGQYVPVGDGGPHVRIRDVVIGGANA